MTNDVERNKALIRAHYEATVNRFDPAAIDEQESQTTSSTMRQARGSGQKA